MIFCHFLILVLMLISPCLLLLLQQSSQAFIRFVDLLKNQALTLFFSRLSVLYFTGLCSFYFLLFSSFGFTLLFFFQLPKVNQCVIHFRLFLFSSVCKVLSSPLNQRFYCTPQIVIWQISIIIQFALLSNFPCYGFFATLILKQIFNFQTHGVKYFLC